jgi:ribosomal protein L11 methyltransferase
VAVTTAGGTLPSLADDLLLLEQFPPAEGHFVFGDGSHPTTRLCAAAVDLLCRQQSPQAMLDVGTGTGILARIARARGVRQVVGTDIDVASLQLARANAALEPHAAPIHFGPESPDHWGARFDLIVANILEAPLRELAAALARALLPGGVLLISGFTRPQAPALKLHYELQGLLPRQQAQLDDWVLLRFAAPS